MKLTKTAAKKSGQDHVLFDQEIQRFDKKRRYGPQWDDRLRELTITFRSLPEYGSTYDYTINISAAEMMYLLESSTEGAVSGRQERAIAKSGIAALRELLVSSESDR